ncbi:MAG: rhomboid family intramembrane serine protease [Bradymonadales bacterium]|nr:rhomboid family intramembrane serine protease [Bradymonadales bacterium]
MVLLSLLDRLLRLLGTSEQQLRWKLHLRRVERENQKIRRQNVDQHLRYQHKHCDHCGRVVDREAKECPYCQQKVSSWWYQWAQRLMQRLFPRSISLTAVLLVTNLLVFLLVTLQTGDIMGLSGYSSVHFGANYGPYMTAGGEWWRLFTYNFIHPGGLLHVGFNLFALTVIGPIVQAHYGFSRSVVLYLGTGVMAGIASHLFAPLAISGGASGAVMGLIGAGVAAGHLQGTTAGMMMRNSLLRWVLMVTLFGIVVPGIDNWAHLGGFMAGLLAGIGMTTRTSPSRRGRAVYRAVAAALVVACLTGMVLAGLSLPGRPADLEEVDVRRLWNRCRDALDDSHMEEAPSACETFARARLLREPLSTLLSAQLIADTGDHRRAHKLLAILSNSLGTEQIPSLPGSELVVPLRNTIDLWLASERRESL